MFNGWNTEDVPPTKGENMTYTYACRVCSKEFDIEQRITDPKGAECPHCKVWTDNRLISDVTNFVLKGGGWYSDGYGNKPSKEST